MSTRVNSHAFIYQTFIYATCKIHPLFIDCKRNADSAAVAGVFSSDCTMQTIATDKAGKVLVKTEQVSRFVSSIAKQKPGVIDEQIVFETIKIDGPLAIVWTPYRFIYNGNFSHSGVNMFCLVNLDGQWKIQYLIDTRRK
jgi:hypothetical protein